MPKISPVDPSDEFFNPRGTFARRWVDPIKPIDSKVQGFVHSQIKKTPLATALAPASENQKWVDKIGERSPPPRKSAKKGSGKSIPVGLRRCESMSALNALLQLILFLPAFRDLFAFAPRSFEPFSEFISQYLADQRDHRAVSSASSQELYRCLLSKLPSQCTETHFDLQGFLFALAKAAFPQLSILLNGSDSIALHPEWHMYWDVSLPFAYIADQHLAREGKHPLRPPEFLVSPKNARETVECQLVQRQYFTHPDSTCYDLDAFIECRPDGSHPAHYIAYLKIDGAWYQCDDERIISMRSTALNLPLHQSHLLHYRQIDLLRR
jgi:hypothetical protein